MKEVFVYKQGKSKVTTHFTCANFDKEKHQDLYAKHLVEILSRRFLNTSDKE